MWDILKSTVQAQMLSMVLWNTSSHLCFYRRLQDIQILHILLFYFNSCYKIYDGRFLLEDDS